MWILILLVLVFPVIQHFIDEAREGWRDIRQKKADDLMRRAREHIRCEAPASYAYVEGLREKRRKEIELREKLKEFLEK